MQELSQASPQVIVSLFANARDTDPAEATCTWGQFTARWATPETTDGTDKSLKEQGEAWSPFTFKGSRSIANALTATVVGLDVDDGADGLPGITNFELVDLRRRLEELGTAYAYHSTFRSGLVAPRHKLRVVVPLDRPVDLATYSKLVDELSAKLGLRVDTSRRADAGLFFSPRVPREHLSHYISHVVDGAPYPVPASGLFKGVRTAVIPTGRRTLEQWCELLSTTTEKHNTLRDAAFAMAAQDKERGAEAFTDRWETLKAALELNPKPVEDWSAAEKTYSVSAQAGYDKATVDVLKTESTASVKVTPGLHKKGQAELNTHVKNLKSFNDSKAVVAAATALGRYIPHVLDEDTVRQALIRAATTGHGTIRPASDITSEIETGLAAGKQNPKGQRHDWQEGMTLDEDGCIDPTEENLTCLLNNHPDTAGIFARNVRTNNTWILSPPPWAHSAESYPARFDLDSDHAAAAIWARDISRNKGYGFKAVQRVIKAVGLNNSFDPFADWIKELRWDGCERLSTWLVKAGGCADTDYTRSVSRRWLIGAVARTFEPGCQMDTVIVLKGAQGVGKSTILRELVPSRDLYSDSVPDIKDKDATQMMNKFAIIEIAELTGFSKQDAEKIKHFITQSKGDMRAAYAEEAKDYPRRSVLAGTTNKHQFLNDPTGARRFWPVEVVQADRQWLVENRDQLWAEAYVMYLNGEQWHLTESEESLAKEAQEESMEVDPNMDKFQTYCENLPPNMRASATSAVTRMPNTIGVYTDQMDGDRPLYWTVPQVCELLGYDAKDLNKHVKYAQALLTRAGYVNRGRTMRDGVKISKYVKS